MATANLAAVFPGDSELAAQMRAKDWSSTPLGPVDTWPTALHTAVSIVLTSRFAMWMAWGDELTMFYNDAYRRDTIGNKHPWALGRPASEVWSEIWNDVEGRVTGVMRTGVATWDDDLQLFLERDGYLEESYHTFSYSPLQDHDGVIRGMICVVTETTPRLIAQRRVALLGSLATELMGPLSRDAVLDGWKRSLAASPGDLPFTLVYLNGELAAATGFTGDIPPISFPLGTPGLVELEKNVWPKGPWASHATHALVIPIPKGIVVAGLNPMRAVDDPYREFVSLFVGQLTSGLAAVDAKIAMQAIEERQARELVALFEQAPVSIAILRGPTHVFELANPRARAILGNRDLVGKPAVVAVEESIAQGFEALLDRVYTTGEPYAGSSMSLVLDGAEKFLDFIYQPIRDADNNVTGIVVVTHDVTDLASAQREAVAANRAKDEFLAMLGHELRNPLAPITAALQLMRMDPTVGGERERTVIDRQVQHLVGLVDDLLDVSRVTRGHVELHSEVVDLADIAAAARDRASDLVIARHHTLEIDVPRGLVVHGDARRLTQILQNLLSNAAKFTPPGGFIAVLARRIDHTIELSVTDTGVGIDAAMLPHVFDAFAQAPQTFDRAQGGLGLGLAIVQNLVKLHGGTVVARSRGANHGSELVVRLPAYDAVEEVPARESTGITKKPPEAKVLVVDDNVDAGELLSELLSSFGYQTQIRFDGPSALADAEAFAPNIAILDLGLPGMDGFELAREILSRPALANTKIIAVTGYGLAQDREKTAAAGFIAHLVKPVDIPKLRALLASLTQASA